MDEFDPDEIDLEKRAPMCVAGEASTYLSPEVRDDITRWVIRSGLGSAYLNLRGADPENGPDLTAEEVGALMVLPFRFDRDPEHYALYDLLREWAFEETGADEAAIPPLPHAHRVVFRAETGEFPGKVKDVHIHADVTPFGGVSVRRIETLTADEEGEE